MTGKVAKTLRERIFPLVKRENSLPELKRQRERIFWARIFLLHFITATGANFVGANFPGLNFPGNELSGANFPGANCRERIFRDPSRVHATPTDGSSFCVAINK